MLYESLQIEFRGIFRGSNSVPKLDRYFFGKFLSNKGDKVFISSWFEPIGRPETPMTQADSWRKQKLFLLCVQAQQP